MKIATWNLARCRPSQSARATWLRDQMAQIPTDIWVLTETYRDFSPRSDFELISSSNDAPDRDTARGECWVAMWARLPATQVDLSADLERCAAIRLMSPAAGAVIVGTVLPRLTDIRDLNLRGEAAYRARLADQAADWKRLLAADSGGLCGRWGLQPGLAHDGPLLRHCWWSRSLTRDSGGARLGMSDRWRRRPAGWYARAGEHRPHLHRRRSTGPWTTAK